MNVRVHNWTASFKATAPDRCKRWLGGSLEGSPALPNLDWRDHAHREMLWLIGRLPETAQQEVSATVCEVHQEMAEGPPAWIGNQDSYHFSQRPLGLPIGMEDGIDGHTQFHADDDDLVWDLAAVLKAKGRRAGRQRGRDLKGVVEANDEDFGHLLGPSEAWQEQ